MCFMDYTFHHRVYNIAIRLIVNDYSVHGGVNVIRNLLWSDFCVVAEEMKSLERSYQ